MIRRTPLKRSTKPIARSPLKRGAVPRKRRPGPPRRGRVVDKEYLAWVGEQPGVIFGGRNVTVHHVRFCGSPKDDRWTLPIELGYHTYQEGPESIEAMSKDQWEGHHGVCIESEIGRLQKMYLSEHPGVEW